jgi:hypothetical protein
MDCLLEATWQDTLTTGRTKLRPKRLKVTKDALEQFLDPIAIAVLVATGKRIAARCNRSAYRYKLSRRMAR